jgi:hypothetical protein
MIIIYIIMIIMFIVMMECICHIQRWDTVDSIQFWDACNQLTFFFFTDEPVVLMVFRNTIDNGDVS